MDIFNLINEARQYVGIFTLSKKKITAGKVSSALLTKSGNVYSGICIDMTSGIGFCAEHSAIAEMLKNRETEIEAIVALKKEKIKYPCGRCRELIFRVNNNNANTKVIISDNEYVLLKDILPYNY